MDLLIRVVLGVAALAVAGGGVCEEKPCLSCCGDKQGESPMEGSLVSELFYGEPPGAFSQGHIFARAPELDSARADPAIAYWHCDIADHDRLTWSEKVYETFVPTLDTVEPL